MINIAGAFSHFNELLVITMRQKLKEISVFDCLGDHPWNGGRVNYLYSSPFSEDIVSLWNSRKVGVFLTLSNRYIDFSKEPVEELSILNRSPLNGVIVSNYSLATLIRKKYPNLKLMLSVTYFDNLKIPFNLKQLEEIYDIICPRYEWVFNPEFYQQAELSKYEVMLNDTCKYNCGLWAKHFDAINRANCSGEADTARLYSIQECWLTNGNPRDGWQSDIEKYGDALGMDLSPNQIKKALKIGYRNWKISGREFSKAEYVGEISEFLVSLKMAGAA